MQLMHMSTISNSPNNQFVGSITTVAFAAVFGVHTICQAL